MEEVRTKELLHWLFKNSGQFPCSKDEAKELIESLRNARLSVQGYPKMDTDSPFVLVITREVQKKYPDGQSALSFLQALIDRLKVI